MDFPISRKPGPPPDGMALRLADVHHWIFDLDNTLYPEAANLFVQIEAKMKAFISERLGIGPEEAYKVQKDYLIRYGTTLRGLMDHHGVTPDEFLDTVHDVDFEVIRPDPRLVDSLERLPGTKYIFTNGPRSHAEAVLERIGAAELMSGIFDIEAAEFIPKPFPQTYAALVSRFDIEPQRTVFIEDMVRNLKPAREMGMTAVWLNTGSEWGKMGYDPANFDIEIHDLRAWLDGLVRGLDETDSKV